MVDLHLLRLRGIDPSLEIELSHGLIHIKAVRLGREDVIEHAVRTRSWRSPLHQSRYAHYDQAHRLRPSSQLQIQGSFAILTVLAVSALLIYLAVSCLLH